MRIRIIYDKSLEHILFALVRPQTLKELKERDIELVYKQILNFQTNLKQLKQNQFKNKGL